MWLGEIGVGLPMARGEGVQFPGRRVRIGWLLRKNRIENGSRADPRGSKPHSYGDSFSESGFVWASQAFSRVSAELSVRERMSINVSVFIALLWISARF